LILDAGYVMLQVTSSPSPLWGEGWGEGKEASEF
jgi:hypothetical protein